MSKANLFALCHGGKKLRVSEEIRTKFNSRLRSNGYEKHCKLNIYSTINSTVCGESAGGKQCPPDIC